MECKRFGICSLFSLHNVLLIQEWYIALFIIFYTGYFKHCVFRAPALVSLFQSRISKAYLSGIRLLKKKSQLHAVYLTMWLKDFIQVFGMNVWSSCKQMHFVLAARFAFLLVFFMKKFSATCKYWFQYASESGLKSKLVKHLKFT